MRRQNLRRSAVILMALIVGLAMSFWVMAEDANAAVKTKSITLKASATTVACGDTVKITVSKVKPAKASKKVTWTISKGKGKAKLKSKKATSVTLKAVKAGTVTVKAKAKSGKATKTIKITITEKKLKNFGITGYYDAKATSINTVPLDASLNVSVWNAATDSFDVGTTADINGNYTALYDTDGNAKADRVEVVRFADGAKKWDATAAWINGAGANTVPNKISDADGKAMFRAVYRLPMGERMLTEYGLGNWSGTTDWANVRDGGYWLDDADTIYNLTSNDSLTMLTGYKTELQPSGSLCVMSSASTVLNWYGQRGDLTEVDLALLRSNDVTERGGTSLNQTEQVFQRLGELGLTCEWAWEDYNDFKGAEMTSDWVIGQLQKGHPIIVISNSYGPHGQVIIGYDTMGTETTNDDVCIMMDPYDTTDQNNDGYIIQPWERLQYSKLTWPNADGTAIDYTGCKYIAVWPKDASLWDDKYTPAKGAGMIANVKNVGNFKEEMKLDYGITAKDIQTYYDDTPYLGDNGLAGAATGGYENGGNHDQSPYYTLNDYYNMKSGDGNTRSLHILPKFKTIQQSTVWTCGTASALMNIEWFGMNEKRVQNPGKGQKETDVSLASHRQKGAAGATSKAGMQEVFSYMASQYGQDWVVFTNDDLDDPTGEESYIGGYCLQAGDAPDWPGLIPYLIDNGIPMMIGSDEWGGHWQVIIGYDSMGTPDATEDDVLILADPYDTTDHNQDGYVIKGFERLVYGWGVQYEHWFGGTESNEFIVAFPAKGHGDVIKALGLQ